MFKYKKMTLLIITIAYIVISIVELTKYLLIDSNLFGLIYLITNVFIIFLLIPLAYNYKRRYSNARVSKLIMIIILGIFSSYILEVIVLNSMNYVDSSKIYIDKIFMCKNILKGVIYLFLGVFTYYEKKSKIIIKMAKNIKK